MSFDMIFVHHARQHTHTFDINANMNNVNERGRKLGEVALAIDKKRIA